MPSQDIVDIRTVDANKRFVGPFGDDIVAAIIVSVLLVPQSLAYALLAGLPPQMGIYASILPLIAYAIFGRSRQLSIGPTAVISIMTAAVVVSFPEAQRPDVAIILAGMTGLILIGLGFIRGGIIINFVPRPVVSAYVTGAALLIIVSQLKHIFGVDGEGRTVVSMLASLAKTMSGLSGVTLMLGVGMTLLLVLNKRFTPRLLVRTGLKRSWSRMITRLMPVILVIMSIVVSAFMGLSDRYNVAIVGNIPAGLPIPKLPDVSVGLLEMLIVPAFVVAIVAFVDSMSITQTLAAKGRQKSLPNSELMGLGAANIAAALGGAYPVNGSLSRSAVNVSAGGRTRWVGVFTAIFMVLAALFLTPYLRFLPLSILAGLIVAACLSLLDFRQIWRTWIYSRADGITALLTFLGVVLFGVQWGVLIGVALAMGLHIRATLKPHMVEVGRIPGTEHYRDVDRYNVEVVDTIVTLRIDESLYYANARYLEDRVAEIISENPNIKHLILMCPAVNRIDASALDSLFVIMGRLKALNIQLHLSEVHTFVKERLHRSNFLSRLTGNVYLSHHQAIIDLEPEPDWSQFSDHIDMH
ncbi:MAG: SulP family inorganic anion transporter [Maricaulaceae bacterium]